MKVLWTVNLPFPEMVEHITKRKTAYCTQSWLEALIAEFSKQNNLEVMVVAPMITDKIYKKKSGNIQHYIIPVKKGEMKYFPIKKNTQILIQEVISDFQPDIIHIHGTEFTHSLFVAKLKNNIPKVVSVQGIIEICARRYLGDILPLEFIRNRRIADFKYGGVLEIKRQFRKRAKYERELIDSIHNVIGRTDWDHAFVKAVNPEARYFHCEEAMRKPFFEGDKWDISKIQRHTVIAAAAYYPIKGFHMLLHAASILKNRYPDLIIKVLGPNILEKKTFKQKILQSDYSAYLEGLIKKYDLQQNISFIGTLSAAELARVMAMSHTLVVPSIVENGSNTLAEAMLTGLPCVASSSGGMMTTISHKETGLLYSFGDYELLAYYVSMLWDNDKLAFNISEKAKIISNERYAAETVCRNTLEIYKEVINNSFITA